MGRYVAGCPKLVEEIHANARSNAPMNRMAREALHASGGMSDADLDTIKNQLKEEILTESKEQFEKEKEALKAELIAAMKKSSASQRRMDLYDERREHKRKGEDMERVSKLKIAEVKHEADMHLLKNKSDIEREQAITKEAVAREQAVTKEAVAREQASTQQSIEERRKIETQIELLKLQKQIEDDKKKPATPAVDTSSIRYFTVPAVAALFGLYDGLSTRYKIRISNQTRNKLVKPPYNVCAKGIVEDRLTGKSIPHFSDSIIPVMKKLIEECKREQLAIPIGDNSEWD